MKLYVYVCVSKRRNIAKLSTFFLPFHIKGQWNRLEIIILVTKNINGRGKDGWDSFVHISIFLLNKIIIINEYILCTSFKNEAKLFQFFYLQFLSVIIGNLLIFMKNGIFSGLISNGGWMRSFFTFLFLYFVCFLNKFSIT